ncbi:MAG TPA: shikimate dehydrogenase [Desulfobulbaceae bacterium]|nr:MAG: shikimate dehydrogenase [Deltaproteobacteria bacterium RIFOXYD12_FULL_53_23]HCC55527.1 shikimate dehydrogenase [Desulfobulbaceae bacterium]
MAINATTEIYGIMGNPVAHSLSPAMHNAAFTALGLNKAYLPFPVLDIAQAMAGLRALGIKGISVTIPHKEAVLPYLDSIDPIAKKIGAVNTLIINNGTIHGANTDWIGANRALSEKISLKGSSILLLGAGGSARAIGFGLLEAGASLTIASRSPEKGRALAELCGCPWLPFTEAASISADILINATSMGMGTQQYLLPVVKEALSNFKVVMDIVYAPLTTRLLQEAEQAGCQTINGLAMLLYQGVAQFELMTDQQAPVEVMRQSLLNTLDYKP